MSTVHSSQFSVVSKRLVPVSKKIKGEEIAMAPSATMGAELIEPFQRSMNGECWGCGERATKGKYCARCDEEIEALRDPHQPGGWPFVLVIVAGFMAFCVLMGWLYTRFAGEEI